MGKCRRPFNSALMEQVYLHVTNREDRDKGGIYMARS